MLISYLTHGQLYRTPLLESLPSASYVIFLDFDGQYVKSQYWNGGLPLQALPSNATENDIRQTWLVVSEDYAPFNINVTTDSTVFHRAAPGKRVRCILTPTSAWANVFTASGVAVQSSFTIASEDVPCWAFNSVGRNAGEVASHEVGHTLGLSHDGRQLPAQPLEPYFPGQNGWGAIMAGSFSTSMLTQWSKGEYAYANNLEDDIAIIGGAFNGFGFRADEAGDTPGSAKALAYSANGTIDNLNDGVITNRNDVDVYTFTTTGGNIIIHADGAPIVTVGINDAARISDLDINMKVMDENGNILFNVDDPGGLSASLSTTLAAGTYYLSIDGVGYLDPATNGYSDYASLGQYYLSGTIPVGVNQAPVVTIQFPVDYASYLGFMLSPYAYATDVDGTVTHVDFYNYDTLLASNAPYGQLVWSYTTPGLYKITARAYDDQGAFTISAPYYLEYVLPEATVVTPVTQSTYQEGSTITISATARVHSKYSITGVEFYDGTTLLSTDNSAPYSFNWINVPAGIHTIYAKALSGSTGGWSGGTKVTVTPVPPPSFTASTDALCAGTSGVVYSIDNVAFGYTYTWTYTGTGLTITSGDGTNSITTEFGSEATSGTLSVQSVSNGVKSSPLSKSIVVSPLPVTPGTIAGNDSPVAGTNANVYSVIAANNTTYQWFCSGSGATLTPDGAHVSIDFSMTASSGTLSVIAQNTCGHSAAATLLIDVKQPTVTAVEADHLPFSVYPNPSPGEFIVQAPSVVKGTIQVSDLLGRTMYESTAVESETLINLSHIAQGTYMLRIQGSGKVFITKIVLK